MTTFRQVYLLLLLATIPWLASSTVNAAVATKGDDEVVAAPSPAAPKLGPPTLATYRAGAIISTRDGAVRDIRAMVATPLECAEQKVTIVKEDVDAAATTQFRMLPRGQLVRQMLISIPFLPANQQAQAVVTYEVETCTILPPEDTTTLVVPKRPDATVKIYLGMSELITPKHPKIRKAVAEALKALEVDGEDDEQGDETVGAGEREAPPQAATPAKPAAKDKPAAEQVRPAAASDSAGVETKSKLAPTPSADAATDADESPAAPTDWQRVEALYDYVIDRVKYKEMDDKSCVQALQDGQGDCQSIGALFVAMCRSIKVPARMVWVHDHQYAEFYLVDDQGQGYWYPIETAGTPAFGEMRIARVILQKGDNFQVPERGRERMRYASDYLSGFPAAPGGAKPSVKYVRELQ